MRTVNLRDDIIWPVTSRLGLDPTVDLMKDFASSLERYTNAWVRKCWDAADWPELSRLEVRTPYASGLINYDLPPNEGPQWLNSNTYNKDSIVRDPANLHNLYISVQNANLNHPLSDGSWWTLVPAWDKTLTYSSGAKV